MELFRLIKECLNNTTYSKLRTDKRLSAAFIYHNGFIQGYALRLLLFYFLIAYSKLRRKTGVGG
jgi:hypothetical protein